MAKNRMALRTTPRPAAVCQCRNGFDVCQFCDKTRLAELVQNWGISEGATPVPDTVTATHLLRNPFALDVAVLVDRMFDDHFGEI